jgi:hypothetical protein
MMREVAAELSCYDDSGQRRPAAARDSRPAEASAPTAVRSGAEALSS